MAPQALNLYTDHVQEHVINLLVALSSYNPHGNTAEILRKFPPQERIFMLVEKLNRRMIEFNRLHREAFGEEWFPVPEGHIHDDYICHDPACLANEAGGEP